MIENNRQRERVQETERLSRLAFEQGDVEALQEYLTQTRRSGEKLTPEQINIVVEQIDNLEGDQAVEYLYSEISKEAKELFKEHFFGIEEVEKAYTIDYKGNSVKLIEFTPEQKKEIVKALHAKLNEPDIKEFLGRMKTRGSLDSARDDSTGEARDESETAENPLQDPDKWMFILRTNTMKNPETGENIPLTMENMQKYLAPDMQAKEQGKLFFNTNWYQNEQFYRAETPNPIEWKLTTKETIDETIDQNYIEQTETLIQILKQNFGENIPPEYQEAINEFENQREHLQELLEQNWRQASAELTNLKITKLLRKSAIETTYDFVVRFKATNQRSHTNPWRYDWGKSLSAGGNLVDVGASDVAGALVSGGHPDYWNFGNGVSFSR